MKNGNGLISNLSWKFAERITAQLVTFVVSIILARVLDPSHYGLISIVTIFITLANVFVSDGFGSALIQKKDADILDFSTVLYFNIAFSILVYIVLFFLAPVITDFYGDGYELLTPVLRVLGVRIIVSGINSVQQAYVSRHMIFQRFFWATLFGTVISAVVGIVMALNGFGVWALVAQYLTNTSIDTIVLALTVRIKYVKSFSIERLKGLFKYGVKILGTKLLITGFMEIRALIIGKVYSSSDLAYYDRGKQFPNLLVTNIDTSIGAVLFPKMSNEQDNLSQVKQTTRYSIRYSAFIMCPMMLGLAVVARPLVTLVLTEKWLPCVPLLQLFCIVYLFQPIHTANMQAIKALGRSDVYLQLEIIKKSIELIVLFITVRFSVEAIVLGMAILTTCYTFVNAFPNTKLLNYSLKEQMADILPTIGRSAVMVIAVYALQLLLQRFNLTVSLVLQVIFGASIYILLCKTTHAKEFEYFFALISSKIRK